MKNLEKNWDNLTKGDVLVNGGGGEQKVIEVLGDIVFLTYEYRQPSDGGIWAPKQMLEKDGHKIKQPEPERWKPKEGERFYFIGVQGEVAEAIYDVDWAKECEFGNCFQTKEQAQEAAQKVKELLLRLHK
jgi:hypothetical protein